MSDEGARTPIDTTSAGPEAERPDESRTLWRQSPDRARAFFLVMGGSLLLYLGLIAGLFYIQKPLEGPSSPYLLVASVGAMTIGAVFFGWGYYTMTVKRAQFLARQRLTLSQNVDRAFDEVSRDAMSLPSLLKLNRELMEQYHEITKTQAEDSYFFGKLASAAGMGVLVAGALVAIVTPDSTTKVVAGGLAAIGTALSGYVSRTFLTTYRSALVQLNWYFEQPLVNSYLLTAERLTARMSRGSRDAIYERIIEEVLACVGRQGGASTPPVRQELPTRKKGQIQALRQPDQTSDSATGS